jgi:Phage integrase family
VHAHMLRHGRGYALANAGHDTRAFQDWLGHQSIQHTVRYTELAPTVQRLLVGLALSRRAVRSARSRRKTEAHLLPARKSDVGGTWLVGDSGLGFLLNVCGGPARPAARRLFASSILRKGRARASREEHCR